MAKSVFRSILDALKFGDLVRAAERTFYITKHGNMCNCTTCRRIRQEERK
jgi:hypothetical protein